MVADRVHSASVVHSTQLHLKRLDRVFSDRPLYFVTACTAHRRLLLTRPEVADILLDELRQAKTRRGWMVGRYVFMPDHLHFFCAKGGDGPPSTLSQFVGQFKQWTSKRIAADFQAPQPIWQREFFDHLLRSNESYESKWSYVRDNPVRAKLVAQWEDWPYAGEIEPLDYP
jgi:REP element-mobilizing transposase RayT